MKPIAIYNSSLTGRWDLSMQTSSRSYQAKATDSANPTRYSLTSRPKSQRRSGWTRPRQSKQSRPRWSPYCRLNNRRGPSWTSSSPISEPLTLGQLRTHQIDTAKWTSKLTKVETSDPHLTVPHQTMETMAYRDTTKNTVKAPQPPRRKDRHNRQVQDCHDRQNGKRITPRRSRAYPASTGTGGVHGRAPLTRGSQQRRRLTSTHACSTRTTKQRS